MLARRGCFAEAPDAHAQRLEDGGKDLLDEVVGAGDHEVEIARCGDGRPPEHGRGDVSDAGLGVDRFEPVGGRRADRGGVDVDAAGFTTKVLGREYGLGGLVVAEHRE